MDVVQTQSTESLAWVTEARLPAYRVARASAQRLKAAGQTVRIVNHRSDTLQYL